LTQKEITLPDLHDASGFIHFDSVQLEMRMGGWDTPYIQGMNGRDIIDDKQKLKLKMKNVNCELLEMWN
jgi:hypothetical protein